MAVTPKAAFDTLTATEYNDLIALARPIGAIKPSGSDQTNATTTLASDPQLVATLAPSTLYKYRGWFLMSIPTASDLKLAHTVPAGVAGWWTVKNQVLAGVDSTVWQNSAAWGATTQMEGSSADKVIETFGIIATGATGGVVTVQFAGVVAGTVIMRAYSMIEFLAQ